MISCPGSYLATFMKSQPFYNAPMPNSYYLTELLYRFISVLNTFGGMQGRGWRPDWPVLVSRQ